MADVLWQIVNCPPSSVRHPDTFLLFCVKEMFKCNPALAGVFKIRYDCNPNRAILVLFDTIFS